MVPESPRPV